MTNFTKSLCKISIPVTLQCMLGMLFVGLKSMTKQMKKLLLLQREYQRELRIRQDIEIPEIDNLGNEIERHKGFVFTTKLGKPFTPEGLADGLERVLNHYNAAEEAQAKKENRYPVLIDKTRVHALRHTYCTRVAEVFSGYENPNYTAYGSTDGA